MKRSEINAAIRSAASFFYSQSWALPPQPKWDVTDFGLGNFSTCGLVLINLAEEREYCEKLMYARKRMVTPCHTHRQKKEDIICRTGTLVVQLWKADPMTDSTSSMIRLKVNGNYCEIASGEQVVLEAGERITIDPGVWHEFWPESAECIIGEVSTANDDQNDNFFSNQQIGRYAEIEEDEPALVKLLSDS